ncbi:hypothetical protein ACFQ9X_50085 [Catenulispora yoronensis]
MFQLDSRLMMLAKQAYWPEGTSCLAMAWAWAGVALMPRSVVDEVVVLVVVGVVVVFGAVGLLVVDVEGRVVVDVVGWVVGAAELVSEVGVGVLGCGVVGVWWGPLWRGWWAAW